MGLRRDAGMARRQRVADISIHNALTRGYKDVTPM